MRCHAELGVLVHGARADLHFKGAAVGADHGGVQRAVVVALGLGDVIVEFGRDRRPLLVHQPERGVALRPLDPHAVRGIAAGRGGSLVHGSTSLIPSASDWTARLETKPSD